MTSPLRRAALTVVLVVLSAGCSSHPQAPPAPIRTDLTALDDARQAFESSRATVLADAAAVARDAEVRDSLDAHASVGAYDPAVTDGKAATKADAARGKALRDFGKDLTAYRAGLDLLDAPAAATDLTTRQVAALHGLVAAGRAEAAAAEAFARSAQAHWSVYDQLTQSESLWLLRAGAGYYPSQQTGLYSAKVAGDAYIVFINPIRDGLTAARQALATGTAAIAAASARVSAAITTLQGQLASLVASPSG